jgi:hypothetical protein
MRANWQRSPVYRTLRRPYSAIGVTRFGTIRHTALLTLIPASARSRRLFWCR